jgi:anti-anti-sigma factor
MAKGVWANGVNRVQGLRRGSPRAQFGIDVDTAPGATTVIPHGEIDAPSAPIFGAVLEAVSSRAVELVTIDLSDVRFCNVAGLRAMTELAARLHASDGRVRIVAPAVLDRMLDLADLRSMFELPDPGAPEAESLHPQLPRRRVNGNGSARPRMSSPRRLATGT